MLASLLPTIAPSTTYPTSAPTPKTKKWHEDTPIIPTVSYEDGPLPNPYVPTLVPAPAPYLWDFPTFYNQHFTPPPTTEYNYDDDYHLDTNPGLHGSSVAFVIVFLAVAAIVVKVASTGRTTDRQVRRPSPTARRQSDNNRAATRPAAPATSANYNTETNNDNVSLRMKILNLLIPRQGSIRRDQMEFDSEDQSYRFKATTTATGGSIKLCGICLENFAEGQVLMMGLCQHPYHRQCCLDWIAKQNSCPLCREKMFDESTYKMLEEMMISR